MAQLSIRRLTLFKQGIGYFERRGDVEEQTISLVVPREATNDVLKSLNVMVYGPGQVLSVDYETPADKARVLSDLPIQLEDRSSMLDLLTSLRGADVTLQTAGQPDSHGRIIGVESSLDAATNPPVVLLQQESRVQMIPLSQVTSLLIHD
ncbi:MAG: hypothetical protein JXB30_10075 [Anaerolineae bacterium]|nr:hypothetical protein [Anaerolineae bacterium]